jgi:hypothetical protein
MSAAEKQQNTSVWKRPPVNSGRKALEFTRTVALIAVASLNYVKLGWFLNRTNIIKI